MANVLAIRSVANSLATWFTKSYEVAQFPPNTKPAFSFLAVSSNGLSTESGPQVDGNGEGNRLTIFIYRVGIDPHLRTAGRHLRPDMDPPPLSLNLHLLFSVWSDVAGDEHTLIAWVMRLLHEHPLLDASSLGFEGEWGADEVVQLIPEELSTEDMMRLWDALTPSYRLSVSYIARVVRIDPETARESAPVIASRLTFQPDLRIVAP